MFSCVSSVIEETMSSKIYIINFCTIFVHLSYGISQRDLILTPVEGLQIHGKIIYYRPDNNESMGSTLWEKTLKHVVYLTLFKNGEDDGKIRDIGGYKQFMQSSYSRMPKDYSKFGDIITLAQGWLEKSDEYRFVEGNCDGYCRDSVLALWKVQKIRHRDSHRGFKYEMRISVTLLKNSSPKKNTSTHGEQYTNSFILNDNDYPESFNSLTRMTDITEMPSNKKQVKILTESSRIHPLNIGEFFTNAPRASSKIGYNLAANELHPTTYKPTYHLKLSMPKTIEEVLDTPKPLVTHHFHHHFFMNEPQKTLLGKNSVFLHNPEAIHIIGAPKIRFLVEQYAKFPIPTTAAPLPPKPFYLETMPIVRYMSKNKETTEQPYPISFKKSEQQFDRIRYSDPDPLYASQGLGSNQNNSETIIGEIHPQIERPQTTSEAKEHTSVVPLAVENNDSEIVFIKKSNQNNDTPIITSPTNRLIESNQNNDTPIITSPTNRLIEIRELHNTTAQNPPVKTSKTSMTKSITYIRNITEHPILKWKPKRKPGRVSSESTQEQVDSVRRADYEVFTKKSICKSVSVKVGNYSQNLHLTRPSAKNC